MLLLREEGYNLIVADVSVASETLWSAAAVVGILVIGRGVENSGSIQAAARLQIHASTLGWLLGPAIFADEVLRQEAVSLLSSVPPGFGPRALIGVQVSAECPMSHSKAQFVLAAPGVETNLPRIVLSDTPLPESPGLLGTVRP